MKRKSVKIQLHHDVEETVQTQYLQHEQHWLKRAWFGFWNALAELSFMFGKAIIAVIKFPFTALQSATTPKFNVKQAKSLGSFGLLLMVALIPFLTASLLGEGWKLGGSVLGVSDGALSDIAAAKEAVSKQDYALAQTNFTDALNKLESLQDQLDQSSAVIQASSKFAPASINTTNLLTAATDLTEAGLAATKLLEEVNSLNFTAQGLAPVNGKPTKQSFELLQQQSQILHEKLSEANQLLAPLNTDFLPAEYQIAVREAKSLLSDLSAQTGQINDLVEIFNQLLLGQKSYLVILQNNNELRATGGFIGTIAQGKLNDGLVDKLDIRTVYDLDGQLQDWIKPPTQLQAVNGRLFLRDSNWFVSFPDSAQQLSVMYEKSSGETPDLIMAITPDLFIEFLKITGPIVLPTYNTTISADNFIEQIQTSTSVGYDKETNQPKQLLADLYPALMQRLNELSKGQPLTMLGLLQKQLNEKNILLYSRNPDLQNHIAKYRWNGAVTEINGDYLQINSSNLNGSKTDLALIRSAQLLTTIDTGGRIRNQITYTVQNPLPELAGLTNKSWVRFLVPQGSQLLGSNGFTANELPELPQANYTTLEQISSWEQNQKINQNTGVATGSESGKTYFAGWIEVPAGQTKTVSLSYELPQNLHWKVSKYQLLIEKQAGVKSISLEHKINFPGRQVRWSNNALSEAQIESDSLTYHTSLTSDSFAGLVMIPQ